MGTCTVTTHHSGYADVHPIRGGVSYGGSVGYNTPTVVVGGNLLARQVYRRRVNDSWVGNY